MWLLMFTADSFLFSLLASYLTDKFLDDRIPIIGSFIGLQKSYNDGIAFGMNLGPFQDLIIIAALIFVVYLGVKTAKKQVEQAAFGLIIGGGLSNLADRAIDGYVTDMIQVGSFPIFNIADTCINIGIFLLLFQVVFGKKNSKSI